MQIRGSTWTTITYILRRKKGIRPHKSALQADRYIKNRHSALSRLRSYRTEFPRVPCFVVFCFCFVFFFLNSLLSYVQCRHELSETIYQGWTSNLKLVWKVRMNVSATLHVNSRPGRLLPAKSMGEPAGGVGWQCEPNTTSLCVGQLSNSLFSLPWKNSWMSVITQVLWFAKKKK